MDRGLLYKPEKTTIRKKRKRLLVEEIPRKKQFQCHTSIKKLGNTKEESSLVNKIPESRGKVYKGGAVEPIFCDYAHDTRCDGKCLIWKDKVLDKQLSPMKKKICFQVLTRFMEIATSDRQLRKSIHHKRWLGKEYKSKVGP
jgi:hypothetical protein